MSKNVIANTITYEMYLMKFDFSFQKNNNLKIT